MLGKGCDFLKEKIYSKKVSVIISFVAFFIVLGILLFGAFPLQMKYGNMGLVATELIILVIAVLGCIITRQKFSEMFPMKLPELRQVFGAFIIWAAMYLMSMAASAISGMLMPERFLAASTSLSGMSLPFKLFAVAVLPPICEEAVHRGFVTHFLKPIERKWIIILVIGVEFGLLHWEPVKFLSTGIAGACLVYVFLKTGNIVLSVFMHFLTNLPAVFISSESVDFMDAVAVADNGIMSEITFDSSLMSLSIGVSAGFFLLLCAAVPWLIYFGSLLLTDKGEENTDKKKKIITNTVVSIVAAVLGLVLIGICFVILAVNISSQIM